MDAWVYANTDPPRVIVTDANYVGQLEWGRIRWPQDPDRRAGFRAVLGVTNDAELGFRRPRRSRSTVADVDRQQFLRNTLGVTVGGPLAFGDLIGPTQPPQFPPSSGTPRSPRSIVPHKNSPSGIIVMVADCYGTPR